MKNTFKKSIIFLLAVVFLLSTLSSCESRPLKSNKTASEIVGTVGNFEVAYEELYFLAKTYRAQLDAKYGDDAYSSDETIIVTNDDGSSRSVILSEYYLERLKSLVYDNIVSNYAVLTLCKNEGITLDSETVQENIQNTLDTYIETDFDGQRSDYKKYLKEQGITDNYIRFNIGVDLLYSGLVAQYLDNGVLEDDDTALKEIIGEQFVRTWHIMILNEDGSADNLARAEEALEKIKSGTSMYKMIGSTYNDDLTITTLDGYYFTKGSMDKSYEEAAYALEINGISDIVSSVGKNSAGEQVDCYYIIQRLELEDAYIQTNFEDLKSSYHSSVVYSMVDELSQSLKFTPNEHGASLDLLNLEEVGQTDPVIITIVASVVVGVILTAATVCLIIFAIKRNNKKILARSGNAQITKKDKINK